MAMNTKRGWLALLAAGLFAVGLAGCVEETMVLRVLPVRLDRWAPGAARTAVTGVVDAAQLEYADLENRALAGKILSVDVSGNQPVVQFQVVIKDTNQGLSGLRTFSLHLAQMKPAVNGSASYWLNYIADGLPLTAMPAANAAPPIPARTPSRRTTRRTAR